MKGSWPKVSCEYKRAITYMHALPVLGYPHPHKHTVTARLGWRHEINLQTGCTWSIAETEQIADKFLALVDGKDLNALLPFPPTVEMLAVWLMVRMPAFYDYIAIDSHDGRYSVQIGRNDIRPEMKESLLGKDQPPSLTT